MCVCVVAFGKGAGGWGWGWDGFGGMFHVSYGPSARNGGKQGSNIKYSTPQIFSAFAVAVKMQTFSMNKTRSGAVSRTRLPNCHFHFQLHSAATLFVAYYLTRLGFGCHKEELFSNKNR